MLNIYPSYIDNTNFKFIKIEQKYLITICVINYPKTMRLLQFIDSIPKDMQYDISIHIKKIDTSKFLKDLTYNLSKSKAESKTVNNNQIDIDIINKLTDDAKKLRYEIQINNEQVYKVYTYICLKSDNIDDILFKIKKIRNILYSKMFTSNILNFRHLQGYLSTIPLNIIDKKISNSHYLNMTTSNVANLFPFFTNVIFDENGVIFGYMNYNNNVCNIDIFSNKYTNSNMCVLGSSGSGKSYFIKLLILRYYITNVSQYIFDPEGEYVDMVSNVGGEYISFHDSSKCFNIMDIDELDTKEKGFLNKKINVVYEFLENFIEINEYRDCIIDSIRKVYEDKEINEDKNSIYTQVKDEKIYINKVVKEMPILEDLNTILKYKMKKSIKLKSIVKKLDELLESYSFLNKRNSIDYNNSLIVFNFNKLDSKVSNILFKYIMSKVMQKIENSKSSSIIYIDEFWKFVYDNKDNAEYVYSIYKTIRKLNAGIVTITQDVSDFFTKDMGVYGKSIFNNSFIKILFKMEYADSDVLKRTSVLKENELNEISKLNKGSMFMLFQSNIVNLNVKANDYENKLIRGDKF